MGHKRKQCISFLLTNACNLNCKYCYLGKKPTHLSDVYRLDLDFIKESLNDFLAYLIRENLLTDIFHIRFFAEGEPTLEIERMKEIKKYAEEIVELYNLKNTNKIKLFTELQTNGFFNPTTAQWVVQNCDIVWISCDGIPRFQDYYRPTAKGSPSSHVIEQNIQFLVDAGITVGIRSTIGEENLQFQKDNIDYFQKLGVSAVFADHMCAPVTSDNNHNLVSVPHLKFAERFVDAWAYAMKKNFFYSTFLMVNFDEECEISCRSLVPFPHITPRGLVSCCDMAVSDSGSLSSLIYGKWNPELKKIQYNDSAIAKIRSRTVYHLQQCNDCTISKRCAGGCAGEAINENNDFYAINHELCAAARYIYAETVMKQPILFAKMLNKDNLYKYLHS